MGGGFRQWGEGSDSGGRVKKSVQPNGCITDLQIWEVKSFSMQQNPILSVKEMAANNQFNNQIFDKESEHYLEHSSRI